MARGRSPLVLSGRTDHVEWRSTRLRERIEHVQSRGVELYSNILAACTVSTTNKRVVDVFDHVDSNVLMPARMFERRLRGYKALGYSIQPAEATRSAAEA